VEDERDGPEPTGWWPPQLTFLRARQMEARTILPLMEGIDELAINCETGVG